MRCCHASGRSVGVGVGLGRCVAGWPTLACSGVWPPGPLALAYPRPRTAPPLPVRSHCEMRYRVFHGLSYSLAPLAVHPPLPSPRRTDPSPAAVSIRPRSADSKERGASSGSRPSKGAKVGIECERRRVGMEGAAFKKIVGCFCFPRRAVPRRTLPFSVCRYAYPDPTRPGRTSRATALSRASTRPAQPGLDCLRVS